MLVVKAFKLSKQGASKHELKCFYNRKREGAKKPKNRQTKNAIKRVRTDEDAVIEEEEIEEEEDTSFDAIFSLTPAEIAKSYSKPRFIDQVNKYAADNKIPMPSNELDSIVSKMPEPETIESKKDLSNYFVLTYAEDIEQKLRNNVGEQVLIDLASKEFDTLDKCRHYFDSATFLANKEKTGNKGNLDLIKTKIILDGARVGFV